MYLCLPGYTRQVRGARGVSLSACTNLTKIFARVSTVWKATLDFATRSTNPSIRLTHRARGFSLWRCKSRMPLWANSQFAHLRISYRFYLLLSMIEYLIEDTYSIFSTSRAATRENTSGVFFNTSGTKSSNHESTKFWPMLNGTILIRPGMASTSRCSSSSDLCRLQTILAQPTCP
jgi:hypothetical protein